MKWNTGPKNLSRETIGQKVRVQNLLPSEVFHNAIWNLLHLLVGGPLKENRKVERVGTVIGVIQTGSPDTIYVIQSPNAEMAIHVGEELEVVDEG